jgi:hypothetical protein
VWDNYFENKRPEFLQRFTENILLGGENDLEPTVTSGQYGTDFKKNDFER